MPDWMNIRVQELRRDREDTIKEMGRADRKRNFQLAERLAEAVAGIDREIINVQMRII